MIEETTSAPIGYTPTHARMLEVLADGMPHTRRELHACLWDEASALTAIQRHISTLRQLLLPKGQTIVCEFHKRSICYRHVRLLHSPGE